MLLETRLSLLFDRITISIDRLRDRRGEVLASAAVALILVALAMIYVRPSFPFFPDNLVGEITDYYRMAEDPFEFPWGAQPRGFRVFVPLISWLLGLRGELMAYTVTGIIFVFVFSVFFRYYRNQGNALVALAIASAFVFSAPILYNIYNLSSPHATRVLLMVFMVWAVRHQILFWALFVAGLFTHEGAALFLPFFLLLRWPHRRSLPGFFVFDVLVGIGLVFAYLPFYRLTGGDEFLFPRGDDAIRLLVAVKEVIKIWAWQGYDGIFSGLKLYWLPILIAFVIAIKDKRWFEGLLVIAPTFGSLGILLVSWDSTRHSSLAAPALIIAFDQLRLKFGDEIVARSFLFLGVINLFVPQQIVGSGAAANMPSLPHMLFYWIF